MTYSVETISKHDSTQRDLALNPSESFIVQAPAGSGKTELLMQRFLCLLGHSKQPEEILAITFTRKAANEMRSRIINALEQANSTEPTEAHTRKTWRLAKKALIRDQELQWELSRNPNRLKIQTIDSLCANITRNMPILSNLGAPFEIIDNAYFLYKQAVNNLFLELDKKNQWNSALKSLLKHLDNRYEQVENLLITMLAKREQWLPHIFSSSDEIKLRKYLEENLINITCESLNKITSLFPKQLLTEIIDVAKFASQNVSEDHMLHVLSNYEPKQIYDDLINFKINLAHSKEIGLALCELLVTKSDSWRKIVNKKNGFPQKKGVERKLYQNMKKRIIALIEILNKHPDLLVELTNLRYTPPLHYTQKQWDILTQLITLLPIAVAQLRLVFQQTGKADYNEIMISALNALGHPQAPSDLALSLDSRICHILVDEFQDTSNAQFNLLELLIAGWGGNDGRTLFLVGDPMQSIYRFRNAEVDLFLQAKNQGIGNIKLNSIRLDLNFRTNTNIVNWFNSCFGEIFPATNDINLGIIKYYASHAIRNTNPENNVHIHPLIDSDNIIEAEHIVILIRKTWDKNPNAKIAILVRARDHLISILPALRKNKLSYQAIEIDNLATRPIIQDLLALTKALLHLADRTAWLAILRSPWCGLSLNDLLIISQNSNQKTIWDNLKDDLIRNKLSNDGQFRCEIILSVIQNAFAQRQRLPLYQWIKQTWLSLQGNLCINSSNDLSDVGAYLQLLEDFSMANQINDIDQFTIKLQKLFAAPDTKADQRLQIMTIHKSKGLEFDTVILPALNCSPPKQHQELLLWQEYLSTNNIRSLILAPIKASTEKQDDIYHYCNRVNGLKLEYETLRLLYVASTRAKQNLHLIAQLDSKKIDNNRILCNPKSNSFLSYLWPAVEQYFKIKDNNSLSIKSIKEKEYHLKRLTKQALKQCEIQKLVDNKVNIVSPQDFLFNTELQKNVGIFIHKILKQICDEGLENWPLSRVIKSQDYWESRLLNLGISRHQIKVAIKKVNISINNTLQDNKGCWILSKHRDSQTEYTVDYDDDGSLKQYIIDRTFIDKNDLRWIIDYKTTDFFTENNLNQTSNKKFDSLKNRFIKNHKEQLINYKKLIKIIDPQYEIRCGLYITSLPDWIEVTI